jgi:hypothetical protein
MGGPKKVDQFSQAHLGWIVVNLDHFYVIAATATDGFVSRIAGAATGISTDSRVYAGDAFEESFDTPKATCANDNGLQVLGHISGFASYGCLAGSLIGATDQ